MACGIVAKRSHPLSSRNAPLVDRRKEPPNLQHTSEGVDMEHAAAAVITFCPHCVRSNPATWRLAHLTCAHTVCCLDPQPVCAKAWLGALLHWLLSAAQCKAARAPLAAALGFCCCFVYASFPSTCRVLCLLMFTAFLSLKEAFIPTLKWNLCSCYETRMDRAVACLRVSDKGASASSAAARTPPPHRVR